MIRKFTLLIVLALATFCSIHAQVILRYGPDIDKGWGDASSVITPYVSFGTDFVTPYSGNKITKIRIGVCSEGTNVYLYIKKKPEDTQNIYRQKIENLHTGWNEITLDTPFNITGTDNITIGYKASFAAAGGVGYSLEKFSDGDVIYYNSKNKWTSTGGSVCIQAIVEGDEMPQNEMLINKISDQIAPYESSMVTFTGVVRNVGANTVNEYTIKYIVDDQEAVIDIDTPVAVNASDTFSIDIPSTVPGIHNLTISIDKVNGEPDAYVNNNTATAKLTVRDKAFMRRVVCEEYTGMWCGWCPRGLVGLELMKEKYPDQFIAISVHGGDVLEIDADLDYSYKPFIQSCSGAPMCNINRKLTGDPYADIQNLFKMETSSENHIAYRAEAEWNADSTAINLTSVYYSDIDIVDPQYRIAYTITEDSVTGYVQTNYYAGGKNGYMYGWENKDEHTDDVCYNDLARAIFSNYAGDPCGAETMTAGTEYVETGSIPIPATVLKKKNIHVVGQIIDSKTGYIVNAMITTPKGVGTSDIEKNEADIASIKISRTDNIIKLVPTGREDTDGLRVSVFSASGIEVGATSFSSGSAYITLPAKGLYVVRIYDGQRPIHIQKIMY